MKQPRGVKNQSSHFEYRISLYYRTGFSSMPITHKTQDSLNDDQLEPRNVHALNKPNPHVIGSEMRVSLLP
jgi:hypothetical protein